MTANTLWWYEAPLVPPNLDAVNIPPAPAPTLYQSPPVGTHANLPAAPAVPSSTVQRWYYLTPNTEKREAPDANLSLGLEVTIGSDLASRTLPESSEDTSNDTEMSSGTGPRQPSDAQTESTDLDVDIEPSLYISSNDLPSGRPIFLGRWEPCILKTSGPHLTPLEEGSIVSHYTNGIVYGIFRTGIHYPAVPPRARRALNIC